MAVVLIEEILLVGGADGTVGGPVVFGVVDGIVIAPCNACAQVRVH